MGSTMDSKEFDLYKDIRCRTNGEIYIGVVGPVRTGIRIRRNLPKSRQRSTC